MALPASAGDLREKEEVILAESFSDLTLAEPLKAAVEELGLKAPHEMQSRLITAMLDGSDVLAVMPPGTGGTTGYLLGLMQYLLNNPSSEGRGPRALVLAPTRDQAMQIGRVIKQLGHDTRLRFGTVVGGRPYPTQHQLLRRPLDILVATPGRLMDHVRRGRVPFERLKLLLLDKADQMLDMGLGSDLYGVVDASGMQHEQTIILSDMPNDAVNLLAVRLTREPVFLGMEGGGWPQASGQGMEAAEGEEDDLFDEEDRQPPGLLSTGETAPAPGRRPKSGRGGRRSSGTGAAAGANKAPGGRQNKVARGTRPPRQGGAQNAGPQATPKTPKNGLRGPGRRVAGQNVRGKRPSNVRFPSDYASGPKGASKAPPPEPRGPKPNEPVQYSADYGFSVAPGARKPVNVVYRAKHRRRRDEGDEVDKTDNSGE